MNGGTASLGDRNVLPPSVATTARMRRTRRRDTPPELDLRKLLHRMGLRYRVDLQVIKNSLTRPDIVFRRTRVAIYVDGCFWHGCPEHGTSPRRNSSYWHNKIAENRARDAKHTAALLAAGWAVARIWEHEPVTRAAAQIRSMVQQRSADAQPESTG